MGGKHVMARENDLEEEILSVRVLPTSYIVLTTLVQLADVGYKMTDIPCLEKGKELLARRRRRIREKCTKNIPLSTDGVAESVVPDSVMK